MKEQRGRDSPSQDEAWKPSHGPVPKPWESCSLVELWILKSGTHLYLLIPEKYLLEGQNLTSK